ncbi:ABC transporter substrate-binding protein [Frigidibacter sp. ROC022]|uniref:ABC transporter substrate-binding protein n=1 Tax=Frigidibacter sp. ROC022 TaxID=2971796 RepID=UPI00215B0594|nr:ABC transporter substrate-binding protein [Frigidibacter sp. ROC022]MCR8725410.1 ABC transporter substrate-binding protein [Frigidibacter sp. ROC022]
MTFFANLTRAGTIALSVWAVAPMLTQAVQAETPQDTLVVGKSADADNLDPAVTMTNNSWTITYPAYERLVQFKVEDGRGLTEVEPSLAASWTTSEDGLTWTFKLAPGHMFDDGTPVDAAAVKASFDRLLAVGKGPSETIGPVAEIQAPDAETVVFTLKEPFGPFLSALATNGASIVNPSFAEHEKDGDLGQAYLAEHTLGSGPYRLESWEKDQQFVLVPNPHYSGPKPALSKIVVKVIKEATARRLQLENGDIDIVEELPIDQLDTLKGTEGVTVVDEPSFYVTYLYLNNTHPPLDNPKVRQALSYAVDYQGIIDGILLGRGIQMQGPVPVGMWAHDDNAKQYNYDPDKARAMLEEAGVKDLSLTFVYAKSDPNWDSIGLVLQQYLADIGVELVLREHAYPTMREKLNTGDFDIAPGNWTPDYGDPSMFMNYWFDSRLHGLAGNRAFYTNPAVDEMIRTSVNLTDQSKREALYLDAQKLIMEDAPYILLFQKNYTFAMRDNVKGFVYNPMLLQMFNFESMSK